MIQNHRMLLMYALGTTYAPNYYSDYLRLLTSVRNLASYQKENLLMKAHIYNMFMKINH